MKPNPIIVALDVESADEARALVRRLGPHVPFYKVGMELYAAEGIAFVRELEEQGLDVFLDLKFYDIPETVRRAVAQVARTGVRFLTIHAVPAVMRAAVEGKGDSSLKLLGVTVLTSFGREDLVEMGYTCVDGIVSSPLEVAAVRRITGPRAILVTPGVRSTGSAAGDQKRVATPAEAVRNGADYLVIGRQITRAADPAAEATRVLEEIAA